MSDKTNPHRLVPLSIIRDDVGGVVFDSMIQKVNRAYRSGMHMAKEHRLNGGASIRESQSAYTLRTMNQLYLEHRATRTNTSSRQTDNEDTQELAAIL